MQIQEKPQESLAKANKSKKKSSLEFLGLYRLGLAYGRQVYRFRWFVIAYLGFRFLVEFIKPSDKPLLGLSAIQVASLLGITAAAMSMSAFRSRPSDVMAGARGEQV